MHTHVEDIRHRQRMLPLTLGMLQFAILTVCMVLALALTAVVLYPALHVRYIQEFGIKPFETKYVFRAGVVSLRASAGQPVSTWGIVWVAPDGPFARVGVRSGDVPSEAHGGLNALYVALQQASSGRAAVFHVRNAADAHLGAAAIRQVTLPPARP
jgi:hypothetical protein